MHSIFLGRVIINWEPWLPLRKRTDNKDQGWGWVYSLYSPIYTNWIKKKHGHALCLEIPLCW